MSSITHTVGPAQASGRRYVIERYVDAAGVVIFREWLAAASLSDPAIIAIRDAHAIDMDSVLADVEFFDRISRVGALNIQYQTAAQFATRLRDLYKALSGAACCALSWWLMEEITAGFLTDAQARNAFGLTAQQWTDKKNNKLIPEHDFWAGAIAAVGD